MILGALSSFALFTLFAGCGLILALYLVATAKVHVHEVECSERLTFDLVRAISLILGGWFAVGLGTIMDPIRMSSALFVPPSAMAVATMLNFQSISVGLVSFLVFQLQARFGWHPWQHPEEEEDP